MATTMNNRLVVYRVVGRYMTGSTVTGYHLVGIDGTQIPATKERIIYMIGKGLIENMRVQSNGDEIILRGKGINLNTLPVYDEKKEQIRTNTAAGQAIASNTAQNTKKSTVNPMGQFTITKRIMQKTSCLGYIVTDNSGKEIKLSRNKVIDLALQGIINNATVQKYTRPGEETALILRGTTCDLTKLPELYIDSSGQIIDPKNEPLRVRVAKMNRGGILYDSLTGKKLGFSSGDFIVCGAKAVIRPIKASDVGNMFTPDKSGKPAVCDDSYENLSNYSIEIFGQDKKPITAELVSKWAVATMTRNKQKQQAVS